jgi:hypothetical protein
LIDLLARKSADVVAIAFAEGGGDRRQETAWSQTQSNQSAGLVRFEIFCPISIFLLASLVAGRKPRGLLVQISR